MLESMYALREDRRKTLIRSEKKGERRGEKRGEKIGKRLGIIETAQNMFKENIDVELIEKITGLSRKDKITFYFLFFFIYIFCFLLTKKL